MLTEKSTPGLASVYCVSIFKAKRLTKPSRDCRRRRSQLIRGAERKDYREIYKWARSEFESRVSAEIQDEALQLASLSLVIALEEAAAAELLHQSNPSLEEQALFRFLRENGSANDKRAAYELLGISEMPVLGEMGMPSTWNLERLDSLAHEVENTLQNNLFAGGSPPLGNPLPAGEEAVGEISCHSYAQAYPMLAIAAVNEVLFVQHGYQGQLALQDPRQYQLPFVLEQGGGAPMVLTVLYMEICSRIGLPLQAAVLEQGQYAVLWPQQSPLLLAGEEVVIDVYSEGALFLLSEVQQLFDLGPGPLRVASKREILCGLLSGLRDLHWCKAVGCRTERALTTPLSIGTALSGAVLRRRGYQIERAVAAAYRCCLIMPHDSYHKTNLALLLYHSGHPQEALVLVHDEASDELEAFKALLRRALDNYKPQAR